MWIVNANAPPALANTGWDFRSGFFPRRVRYKKDAEELAKEAKAKGGLNVTVTKESE